jgi:hypothetical protein
LCDQYWFQSYLNRERGLNGRLEQRVDLRSQNNSSKKFLVCALSRLSVEDTSDGVPWFGVKVWGCWLSAICGVNNKPGGWSKRKAP